MVIVQRREIALAGRLSEPDERSPAVTNDSLVSQSMDDSANGPRLALKPEAPLPPRLDGAWWPRSGHLATELPGLIAELSYRLGEVNLVGYLLGNWTETPPEIEIAGQTIKLVGLTSDEPNSIVLVGKAHRIALRVIAPDVAGDVAERQLDEASSGRGATRADQQMVNQVAAKLNSHEASGDPTRLDQITKWCGEVAEQFVEAPIQVFVPILIENMVRDRMDRERNATHRR
ncbi:DUF5994 family protein [Mycobacterium sp. OTB74]|uniref:DUF5994 family protein n=1 Tax=Mycobacterium sp. OTB74 TaxID=1853452 RepID=UPI002475A10B|nr:DUF5994 family protein [Mycobacterium sp. OTB74]MDH6247198.1 hypothetical protein [Mycobacterium sp. OTB74]